MNDQAPANDPQSDAFETFTTLVDIPAKLLAAVAFKDFEAEVKRAHPEAHEIAVVGVKPDGLLSIEVSGLWRAAPAAAVAKDEELRETRLGTEQRAQGYVNVLTQDFLRNLAEDLKRTSHAGATPDDRKDAHLALNVVKGVLQALEYDLQKIMARTVPVLVVDGGGRPDQPPPGGAR